MSTPINQITRALKMCNARLKEIKTVSDKDFTELVLQTSNLIQELHDKRANESAAARQAFAKAMATLREIRRIHKPTK